MEENNFKTPEAELITETSENSAALASRWKRLGGSLIDTIILLVVLIPIMFITGFTAIIASGEEPGFVFTIMLAIVGMLVFFAINFKFLKENGQTIGKKAMGTKIVALDGSKALMNDHLAKRYATYFIPNQIPIIGAVFGLVNVLFIFGAQKRCIHDLAGKTKVVDC